MIALLSTLAAADYHPGHKVLPLVPRRLAQQLKRHRRGGVDWGLHRMVAAPSLSYNPATFGGDPTGVRDSTDAVLHALALCVNASRHTKGTFPDFARDGRGCSVDLAGGEYLVSKPLQIPTYTSNLRVGGGSLVANPRSEAWAAAACGGTSFPRNRTGEWCQGLQKAAMEGANSDAESCMRACCDAGGCSAWQYCAAGRPCDRALAPAGQRCWLAPAAAQPYDADKQCSTGSASEPQSEGWVGASSTVAPTPPEHFMIIVGGTSECISPHQGSCNEDIGFPELFLDGSTVANGIQINQVMGTTVGPTTYILNFSSFGIQVNGGHEVMIDQTWLGERNFGAAHAHCAAPPTLTDPLQIITTATRRPPLPRRRPF